MKFAAADPNQRPWLEPSRYWPALTRATEHLDPPVAALDMGAVSYNAYDMANRAGGKPIRVASKSIRVRAIIDALLELPEYSGVLAYCLPEALWLAENDRRRHRWVSQHQSRGYCPSWHDLKSWQGECP